MRRTLLDHVAMESVDFQSPVFFKELALSFSELKKLKKDEIGDSDIATNLSKIVAHHTGLNVVFDIGENDPSVEIPMVDKNNPLINSFIRNYISSSDGIKMIANAGGVARGTVSLRTGKVSGIFTEIKSKIWLPVRMLITDKFTPEEIAAITLHEVGHLFTYYEFITRTVTTNQVLAGLAKALDGTESIDQREAVLINVKRAMNLKDMDTRELAKSNNKKVAEIVVVSNIVKQTESEIGSNVYDFSTWEMLADQFAARFGAGRDLVTGLDKLYRGSWNISFRSLPAYLALEALKLVSLFIIPGMALIIMSIDGAGDGTYDRPGARMKRIRNQIVENLKDTKLSKDDQERLKADLAAIDDVLKCIEDRRQFVGVLWDVLIPSARKALNQERLQKDLEAIAANDLFVKAADLKALA